MSDDISREAFTSSIVLRRVLKMQLAQKEEVSAFIKVRPGPVMFTYGVGVSLMQLARHIELAAARVGVPRSRL